MSEGVFVFTLEVSFPCTGLLVETVIDEKLFSTNQYHVSSAPKMLCLSYTWSLELLAYLTNGRILNSNPNYNIVTSQMIRCMDIFLYQCHFYKIILDKLKKNRLMFPEISHI